MPTSEGQFDQLANRALSLNPKAMRTCPWCLYELEGLLKDGMVQPCPECGREVSGIINLTVWGRRARRVRLLGFMTFGWVAVVVVWAYLAPFAIGFVHMAAGNPTDPGPIVFSITRALTYSAIIPAAVTPLVAFVCCLRWLTLRFPTISTGQRLAISASASIANTWLLALGLWPYILLFTAVWP